MQTLTILAPRRRTRTPTAIARGLRRSGERACRSVLRSLVATGVRRAVMVVVCISIQCAAVSLRFARQHASKQTSHSVYMCRGSPEAAVSPLRVQQSDYVSKQARLTRPAGGRIISLPCHTLLGVLNLGEAERV